MRIAILSCFYPFRGGIAQFNANLFEELGREHDVRAFNFTRQYPSILFPGKTQKVTPEDEAVPIESEALLDTANPFSWGSTARKIAAFKPDVLILRYWMSWFAPSLGSVARKLKRTLPQCKVVAILDNVIPHEPHFSDRSFTSWFLKATDGCVTMCAEVEQDLLSLNPGKKHIVLHHPVYSHFGQRLERSEAVKRLGIKRDNARNLLFFGLIRDYKGLDVLLRAFTLLDDGDYNLVIAGEPYGSFDKYQALIDACPRKENIYLFPDYIRDSEVKNYFSACDLTVLPYKSATQSGISAISNHFEVPMVVTDVGGLKETVGESGTGIVCAESSPECVCAAIRDYFADPSEESRLKENIRTLNRTLSWNNFCSSLMKFIGTL